MENISWCYPWPCGLYLTGFSSSYCLCWY